MGHLSKVLLKTCWVDCSGVTTLIELSSRTVSILGRFFNPFWIKRHNKNTMPLGTAETRSEKPLTIFSVCQLSTKAFQEMLLNTSQNINVSTKNYLESSTWPQVCIICHLLIFKPSYLRSATLEALLVCHNCPFPVNYPAFTGAEALWAEGFFTNAICSEKVQPFSLFHFNNLWTARKQKD